MVDDWVAETAVLEDFTVVPEIVVVFAVAHGAVGLHVVEFEEMDVVVVAVDWTVDGLVTPVVVVVAVLDEHGATVGSHAVEVVEKTVPEVGLVVVVVVVQGATGLHEVVVVFVVVQGPPAGLHGVVCVVVVQTSPGLQVVAMLVSGWRTALLAITMLAESDRIRNANVRTCGARALRPERIWRRSAAAEYLGF